MIIKTYKSPYRYIEKSFPKMPPKETRDINFACNYSKSRASEVANNENIKLGWRKWEAK